MTLSKHDLFTILGYESTLLKDNFDSSNCLKANFYTRKKVGDGSKVVPTLFFTHNLDL
jgi:hypothetical protein